MTKEQQIEEKEAEIREKLNLLEQGDYISRKCIAELYSILKAADPSLQTPVYDEYTAQEAKAQEYRERISELRQEIKDLED